MNRSRKMVLNLMSQSVGGKTNQFYTFGPWASLRYSHLVTHTNQTNSTPHCSLVGHFLLPSWTNGFFKWCVQVELFGELSWESFCWLGVKSNQNMTRKRRLMLWVLMLLSCFPFPISSGRVGQWDVLFFCSLLLWLPLSTGTQALGVE